MTLTYKVSLLYNIFKKNKFQNRNWKIYTKLQLAIGTQHPRGLFIVEVHILKFYKLIKTGPFLLIHHVLFRKFQKFKKF